MSEALRHAELQVPPPSPSADTWLIGVEEIGSAFKYVFEIIGDAIPHLKKGSFFGDNI